MLQGFLVPIHREKLTQKESEQNLINFMKKSLIQVIFGTREPVLFQARCCGKKVLILVWEIGH